MAVRWVTRLLDERVVCLLDLGWLSERLLEAAEPTPTDAPKFVRQWLARQPRKALNLAGLNRLPHVPCAVCPRAGS